MLMSAWPALSSSNRFQSSAASSSRPNFRSAIARPKWALCKHPRAALPDVHGHVAISRADVHPVGDDLRVIAKNRLVEGERLLIGGLGLGVVALPRVGEPQVVVSR